MCETIKFGLVLIPSEVQKVMLNRMWNESHGMRTTLHRCTGIRISGGVIQIPDIGDIRHCESKRRLEGEIETIELFKTRNGIYRATVTCLRHMLPPLPSAEAAHLRSAEMQCMIGQNRRLCAGPFYQAEKIAEFHMRQGELIGKQKGSRTWHKCLYRMHQLEEEILEERRIDYIALIRAGSNREKRI